MIQFRIAKHEDLNQVTKLRWDFRIEEGETAQVSREEFERQCLKKLEEEAGQWTHFLAIDDDRAVGMVSFCSVPKILSPDMVGDSIAYVTNTYVIPERRNDNIGSKLLEFALGWSRNSNIEVLFVWPSERSRAFYNRLGFRAENEIMELPVGNPF